MPRASSRGSPTWSACSPRAGSRTAPTPPSRGCAVYEAIADGELSERRWQAYRKLKAEAAFAEDKAGYLAQKERKYKEISKAVRRLPVKR